MEKLRLPLGKVATVSNLTLINHRYNNMYKQFFFIILSINIKIHSNRLLKRSQHRVKQYLACAALVVKKKRNRNYPLPISLSVAHHTCCNFYATTKNKQPSYSLSFDQYKKIKERRLSKFSNYSRERDRQNDIFYCYTYISPSNITLWPL